MELGWLVVAIALPLAFVMAMSMAAALRRRARMRWRLRTFADMLQLEEPEVTVVADTQRAVPQERNALVARLEARYPLSGGVRTTLIALGVGVGIGLSLVPILTFFGLSRSISLPLAAGLGGALAWNVGGMLEDAKRVAFNDRFLPAVEDFQRMVHFGIAAGQALSSITGTAGEPLAASLRTIRHQAELGVPLAAAMEREARRVRVSELAMLAAIMSTQERTGGNLSEAVANLASMLRERLDNRARMKASTAEARVTLVILSGVPLLAIGIQASLQPDILDVLLGDARHLLGIGAAMIVSGLVVAWLLIRHAQR